ncbi:MULTISPECIES: tetratricopeptide repeat protein [Nostocaceae]|jgi:cytochrome c-type biogenesis protein CcmH/NrfG|uniref:tetratricopeptide repeat protein n=1 Tax=Nostocaceae TaxID=1162 RepID=UPI00168674E9|nr:MULTISPECIES: tetratricopeptide repeat protein [Nostocaceae]MBD2360909.1 tetratricopeptide repeat protein [Anabaena minutissima FACHB-250]MEA5566277.1 tetratricopeptide repeat protein [Anabaena sp. UHCC 0399]UKO97421.1 tetratricopeptide repeat protein [Nostoc sp. UHCC 0870]
MTQTVESLFDTGLSRYKAGEPATDLIPVFKEVCDRSPKTGAAWICLAWLYLLEDKYTLALKAAQKAVKLNPQDPQARVNLAVAMLETNQKGIRQHIDVANQLILVNPEWREEIQNSIEDGFSRKPDWQSLAKVKAWVLGE